MKAHLLLLCVLTATLAAACDEDPPQSAYDTETPFETPTPGVTPVAVTIPAGGAIVSASGRIGTPGEADQFLFTLAAGDKVRIDVDAQGMIPSAKLLDAVVTLYAPDGGVAAVADDGTNSWDASTVSPGSLRDPYLIVDAAVAGEYTLVLEDANGGGGASASYDYDITFSRVVASALPGGLACADAQLLPAITAGAIVSVTSSVDAISSTDSCCGAQVLACVGAPVSAKDVSYLAALTSGSRVQITRTGSAFDGAIYVTRPNTTCGGGPNTIENACVAGADGANADGFVFTPTETGNYFVWVDGVANSGGAFTLDVRLLP